MRHSRTTAGVIAVMTVLLLAAFLVPAVGQDTPRGCPSAEGTDVGGVAAGSTEAETVETEADKVAVGLGGDDCVIGDASDDQLDGNGGGDTLEAGPGDDDLSGGTGNDVMEAGRGNDDLSGDPGDDTATGGNGRDHIGGDQGDDNLSGDSARDYVSGDEGNDTLSGGESHDTLIGGPDADTISGGPKGDWLFAGGGSGNLLYGGEGDDYIDATNIWPDKVYCGSGYDTAIGDWLDKFANCELVLKIKKPGRAQRANIKKPG